jgi:hypothetical protein
MAKVKATPAQCVALYNARAVSNYERKNIKKAIFIKIRQDHGLQGVSKLGIRSLLDINNPNTYGVLYDKHSKVDLNDGKAEVITAPVAPVTTVAAPTPKVTKPVVKTAVVVKAKPVAVSIPGVSPVRTAKCTLEIRTTINGVRKRLGFASSENAKQAAIAAAKANS